MSNEFDDGFDDETVAAAFDVHEMATSSQSKSEAYLIVLAGSRVGEMIRVGKSMTIGRGSATDFRVNDAGASKEHVTLTVDENNHVTVTDLESRNGTFINGNKITVAQLNDGDKIHVGSTTILKFSYADRLDESFQQQMYDAALRDPLTGLYNRRHLMEQLDTEFSYSTRHRFPLSLIIFDIDHFKKLNDSHGHLVGDDVLRGLAEALRNAIRKEDLAARYGGEEFCVICRGTTSTIALTVAERIRRRINETQVTHELPELRITISGGVAGLPHPDIGDTLSMINAADKALYKAKDGGRNRICIHPADTEPSEP